MLAVVNSRANLRSEASRNPKNFFFLLSVHTFFIIYLSSKLLWRADGS